MKVLEINTVCNGSTGHIAQDIAKEFISKGDECVIAYGRGNPPKDINSYKIGGTFSIYFHVFITRLFDKHGLGSKYATKKFIKWIESYKPDLVWLHNIHGYYLNYKLLFKYLKDSGVNVKWTFHDCWAFTGHCAYFDFVKCEKWKTKCEKCPSKKDYPANLVFGNTVKNYNNKKEYFNLLSKDQLTIITPSKWLSNLVTKSFLNKYKVEIVNNKIDLSVFKPTPSDIKQKYGIKEKIILGVASVWDRRKGLDDFVELSKYISSDYKIVLIGLKEKQLEAIPPSIIGIKRTENQLELVKWYSSAFCFFCPSYEDNYPTVLLEANACGCTTVSYNTGGCPEIAKVVVKDIDDFILFLNNYDKN